jgi:hypothetical protein
MTSIEGLGEASRTEGETKARKPKAVALRLRAISKPAGFCAGERPSGPILASGVPASEARLALVPARGRHRRRRA